MSDNRRVFEEVLTQLSGAQQMLNQVPLSAEQRRLSAEEVAREEARFQQTREDNTTNQARQIALENIRQLNEAIAMLEPGDPLLPRLNAALQQQQQALTLTGQPALDAAATGEVTFEGAPVTSFGAPATLSTPGGNISMTPSATVRPDVTAPTGQVIAAGASAARAASEARAKAQREEERSHDVFMAEMGFDFQSSTLEKQQAFQALQAQADRALQRGLTTQQIAAQLFQQAREHGFQGTQNDLERALNKYNIDTQAGLARDRLSVESSAAATERILKNLEMYNPEIPEDAQAIADTVAEAEDAGLQPWDLTSIRLAARAQTSAGAQAAFAEIDARLEGLTLDNAYKGSQTEWTNYQILKGRAEDAQALPREAASFVEETVKLGAMGVPTLQAMLGAMESDNIENSPYAGFLQHLDIETLRVAVAKAEEFAEDQALTAEVARAEAINSMVEKRVMSLDIIADLYDPERLYEIARMTDEQIGDDLVLRQVRTTLNTSGSLSRAVQLAEYRQNTEELQQAGPRLSWAQSQLTFYSTHRPEDIEVGADGVRAALQVMADAGLIGDPDDPDDQKAEIERTVSFYRQAWGDDGSAFDAELAESASRTALNNANAARALAEAEADGGANLEVLKFQMDLVKNGIEATVTKAEGLGCTITPQGIRVGEKAVCDGLAMEVASWQQNYNALLMTSGFRTVEDIEYANLLQDIAADVAREKPNLTQEERDAEVAWRVQLMMAGFRKAPTSGGPVLGPQPNPDARPAGPGLSPADAGRAAGAAFREGVGGFGRAVGDAGATVGITAAEFLGGLFNPGATTPSETPATWQGPAAPGVPAPRPAGGSTGGGGGGPFSSRVPAPDPKAPFASFVPQSHQLLDALIAQESGGRHVDANGNLLTSAAGAQGITQVMPNTGRSPGLGVKPLQGRTEAEYLRFGRDYLAALLQRYGGDESRALGAYNAGIGNVDEAVALAEAADDGANWLEYLQTSPEAQAETVNYVRSIMARMGG